MMMLPEIVQVHYEIEGLSRTLALSLMLPPSLCTYYNAYYLLYKTW